MCLKVLNLFIITIINYSPVTQYNCQSRAITRLHLTMICQRNICAKYSCGVDVSLFTTSRQSEPVTWWWLSFAFAKPTQQAIYAHVESKMVYLAFSSFWCSSLFLLQLTILTPVMQIWSAFLSWENENTLMDVNKKIRCNFTPISDANAK